MTQLQNSAFKVDSGSVPDVSKILPEPGAFIISEHDGNLYYADEFGWHQAEQPYSPITLFVDFDGVTQFDFKFKAPATSTLEIHDGDGTVTEVAGNDDTEVTHTTNYAAAGLYYFTVKGDLLDITSLEVVSQPITFDVNALSVLKSATLLSVSSTKAYGDASSWADIPGLADVGISDTAVAFNIEKWSSLINGAGISFYNCGVYGNVAKLSPLTSGAFLNGSGNRLNFDTVELWDMTGFIFLQDNNFTSKMVDNALQSFVNLTGCTINLGGNNASRTAASDDALFALLVAGNTVTVNEDNVHVTSPVQLEVDYTDTQFAFKFKLPATKYLLIYDGDGTRTLVQGQDGTLITHTTNYATAGTYYFYVEGDYLDITQIAINGQDNFSGSLTGYSALVNLVNLNVNTSGIYGSIDGFSAITGLELLYIQDTLVEGDLSVLSSLEGLAYISSYNSNVTFNSAAPWQSGISFQMYSCNWTEVMVDNAIQAFSGLSNTSFNISGNNAYRSQASDSYLETLVGNSNVIVLKEKTSIGELGPELHVDANAASDPNGNEADAVTGWAQTGLDVGDNEFISQSFIKKTGLYALKANANPNPTASASVSKTFTVEALEACRLELETRHIGIGGNWRLRILASSQLLFTIFPNQTEFQKTVTYFTPPTTEALIVFSESGSTNDGGIYLDNLSVRKVTLP